MPEGGQSRRVWIAATLVTAAAIALRLTGTPV